MKNKLLLSLLCATAISSTGFASTKWGDSELDALENRVAILELKAKLTGGSIGMRSVSSTGSGASSKASSKTSTPALSRSASFSGVGSTSHDTFGLELETPGNMDRVKAGGKVYDASDLRKTKSGNITRASTTNPNMIRKYNTSGKIIEVIHMIPRENGDTARFSETKGVLTFMDQGNSVNLQKDRDFTYEQSKETITFVNGGILDVRTGKYTPPAKKITDLSKINNSWESVKKFRDSFAPKVDAHNARAKELRNEIDKRIALTKEKKDTEIELSALDTRSKSYEQAKSTLEARRSALEAEILLVDAAKAAIPADLEQDDYLEKATKFSTLNKAYKGSKSSYDSDISAFATHQDKDAPSEMAKKQSRIDDIEKNKHAFIPGPNDNFEGNTTNPTPFSAKGGDDLSRVIRARDKSAAPKPGSTADKKTIDDLNFGMGELLPNLGTGAGAPGAAKAAKKPATPTPPPPPAKKPTTSSATVTPTATAKKPAADLDGLGGVPILSPDMSKDSSSATSTSDGNVAGSATATKTRAEIIEDLVSHLGARAQRDQRIALNAMDAGTFQAQYGAFTS